MASVRHLEFAKFRFFWTNIRPGHWNLYLLTKFYLNRIIHGWDIEIKLFSKWRPSAILNLRKLPFWSRDLYLHVILHLCSKFCINWPVWRRDIAKNDFQYGVCPPSWICFWLEIAYFGLNFDDFWWKIGKNVKIKYSNPQKAHPWHKTRLLSIKRWRFICRRDL